MMMMMTALACPVIQSVGPPPQLHADRVVAEMLRWLVDVRAGMDERFWQEVANGSFGNPLGQQRVVERLRRAGGRFISHCNLQPAKRCRFKLTLVEIDVWDPASDERVDAVLPDKPWLAMVTTSIKGEGPHRRFRIKGSALLFLTHHALSRLAQRCGARDAADLLIAADELFHEFARAAKDDARLAPKTVPHGYQLPFALPHRGTGGVAILSPHDRADRDAAVVTTILDPSWVTAHDLERAS
jgi:hypothetical protein